ncbi:cyclin-D-binding Myb-like transcription factor 1 [Hibiscus syriacus]|uniref:cyclin-D-binding Myb-like transcription factor 1 n=1 Tax=Hibiscus syriacus TaxID=106335 RepID=UPI0019240E76|nr:cyclin-D-binding Myb-like transcription factor 1 [Hibiscus syriacus]
MGKKKMSEKDGHERGNKQVEEGKSAEKVSDGLDLSTVNLNDVTKSNNRDDNKNEQEDRIKKRKSEFDSDEKEYHKIHKKYKKSKSVLEVEEISKKTAERESTEAINLENNGEAKRTRKDKHRKKKKKKKQELEKVNGAVADEKGTSKGNSAGNEVECRKLRDTASDFEVGNGHNKKKKSKSVINDTEEQKICTLEDTNKIAQGEEEAYQKPKKKKKQEPEKVHSADENGTSKVNSAGNEIESRKLLDAGGDIEDGNGRKKKKKKSKSVINDAEGGLHEGDQVENATPKDKSKKVSFRDQVEVFPSDNANKGCKVFPSDNANKGRKDGLVYGKRYSKEEDELLMKAVADYIESRGLGDEGINMVMNCGAHPEVRNCWKEIQAAIPWRPLSSVYGRAHVIFERDEKHPWTPEELETVKEFVEKHGRNWRLLADSLGKHRHHVKDTWRRIKLTNVNKGRWSQEEFQNLFDLVNVDLSMKAHQDRISKHGMLRDNICWTAISDKMETRPFVSCCVQWYGKLTSPMVADGVWSDVDDYRMIDALSSLDACCMEDVDWDNLLEHRSGDVCRKRWGQMIQNLDPNKDLSFAEQVDVLANRYRPDMIEARETYDNKIPIDLP